VSFRTTKLNILDSALQFHPWYLTIGLDEEDTVLIFVNKDASEETIMDIVDFVDLKVVEIIFTDGKFY